MRFFCSFVALVLSYTACGTSYAQDSAKKPQKSFVEVGGWLDTEFGIAKQASAYGASTLPDNTTVNNFSNGNQLQSRVDSRIQVKVKGDWDHNLKYGALIELQSAASPDDDENGFNSSKNFIFLETVAGKLEIGVNKSASENMRIDASTMARGTGGIMGSWFRYVNFPVHGNYDTSTGSTYGAFAAANPVFMLRPGLPNAQGFTTSAFLDNNNCVGACQQLTYNSGASSGLARISSPSQYQPRVGWGANANKISFYTPRINGAQFGLSYTPNTGNVGTFAKQPSNYAYNSSSRSYERVYGASTSFGNVTQLLSAGFTFIKQYNNLGVSLSATIESGKFQSSPDSLLNICSDGSYCTDAYRRRNDLSAYALGFNLTYLGFTFGGSYGSWGRSLYYKENLRQSSGVYDFRHTFNADLQGNVKSFDKADYYTTGVAYGFGPIDMSLTQMRSRFMGNIMDVLSLGTDFKIAGLANKGIILFAETTRYQFTSNPFYNFTTSKVERIKDNRGVVFIGGVRLSF